MVTAVFLSSGQSYDNTLIQSLSETGYEVTSVASADEMLALVTPGGIDALVCSIQDSRAIEGLISLIKSSDMVLKGLPKMVFLSSLMCWAGSSSSELITVTPETVARRRPALGVLDTFRLENLLMKAANEARVDAHVIGVGSVYGGSGFDLEYIFRALWTDGTLTLETPLQGTNRVPMCHIDTLTALVRAKLSASSSSSSYTPAIDGYEGTVASLLGEIAAGYNGSKVVFSSARVALMDDISASPENALWNQDLAFTPPTAAAATEVEGEPSSAAAVDVPALWKSFLSLSNLQPCKVVLAGPPAPFKTATASAMARHMTLRHVTPTSAVEYVKAHKEPVPEGSTQGDATEGGDAEAAAATSTTAEGEVEEAAAPTVPKSALGQLQDSLKEELEAGYVPAKGGPAFEFETVEVTLEMALKLSPELLRRCVAAELAAAKRGYVLDLWDNALAQTTADLQSFCPRTEIPATESETTDDAPTSDSAAAGEGPITGADASAEATTEGDAEAGALAVPEVKYTYDLPEVIVEVRASTEETVTAWAAKQGLELDNPKMDKADAALLADVKGKLEAYMGTLVDMPSAPDAATEEGADGTAAVADAGEPAEPAAESAADGAAEATPEPEVPAHLKMTHPGVLEMMETYQVVYVDASALAFDVAAIATAVCSDVCAARGPIGWALQEPVAPEPVVDAEAEAEAEAKAKAEAEAEPSAGPSDAEVTPAMEDAPAPIPAPTPAVEPEPQHASASSSAGGVASLSSKHQKRLYEKTAPLESYVVSTVGAHVAEAMVTLERSRPEDPLAFMVDFLEKRASELEAAAESAAREKFDAVLAQATALSASRQ